MVTSLVTSLWFWPALGIAAVAVAGWTSSGPSAPLAVALVLAVLVVGFAAGLYVAGGREPRSQRVSTPGKTREPRKTRKMAGKRVSLRGANLRNADLRGADLSGADMEGVDLRGANLAPLADDGQ